MIVFFQIIYNFHSIMCHVRAKTFYFDFIGLSVMYRAESRNLELPGYHQLIIKNREGMSVNQGGVSLYVKDCISYSLRKD